MNASHLKRRLLVLFLPFFWGVPSWASILSSPQEMMHELLSESVPTAFEPMEIEARDFSLQWEGQALDGVRVSIEEGSIQWSRVNEILVLPRARLQVEATGVEGGRITYFGFTSPLSGRDRSRAGTGSMPVALISGSKNAVDLYVRREGKEMHGRIRIFFRPQKSSARPRIFSDPSCSRFGLQAEPSQWQSEQWVFIGCRPLVSGTGSARSSILEVYVFWDGAGEELEIEGSPTPSSTISIWALKLISGPGALRLRGGGQVLDLKYSLPERLHFFSLGMGLGPYDYEFKDSTDAVGNAVSDSRPLLTLYGSYFFSETIRIVGFNALAIGKSGFNDLGIYFSSENFRIIDRRLSLNLLLGGHIIGFQSNGSTYLLPGAPQGIEMIFIDFLQKGSNLSLGGFVYPKIDDKAYYNLWIRWGSKIFAEVNYILWEEKLYDRRVYSRSLGVSLGFPIARFF